MLLHHDSTATDLCSVTYPQEVSTDGEPTDGGTCGLRWVFGWRWMWRDVGRRHRRGEVSAASCHVGFQNRESGAPGRTSLCHQL